MNRTKPNKTRINLSVDPSILYDAKKVIPNMSGFLETKLSEFLCDYRRSFYLKCTKCGSEATAEVIINHKDGCCANCGEQIVRPFPKNKENGGDKS